MDNNFTHKSPAALLKYTGRYFRLAAVAVLLVAGLNSFGQLSGTYTIPGSYATIAAAVTALNTQGVSGPVIFNCAGGGTETAPSGGIKLGSATLSTGAYATSG